jgi:RNA polymerase sigma-70 factor (ECF subfamily)
VGDPERRTRYGETFAALLEAARAGSGWAWEEIYGWLAGVVSGYLRVQGAVDPDDLTSEVFIGVFRGMSAFDGTEEQFRSWVFVIAHRRLIDQRRAAGRRPAFIALDGPEDRQDYSGHDVEADAATAALNNLATARVEEWCASLVPDQRDVLLLRVVGDLTVEQVADALGKSSGAVKALQRRALEAIRKRISTGGVPL